MLIEEYGFIVFYNGKRFSNLEDGLPEPEFGNKVEIRYNGKPFTVYTENAAHISCGVFYTTTPQSPPAGVAWLGSYTSSVNIAVEKNKLYKKWGRESTMLSKILYVLGGKKHGEKIGLVDGQDFNAEMLDLIAALRKLVDEKYHNIYAIQREEKDVC